MSMHNNSPKAIAAELGDRIKTARLNANITQKDLAKKAGVSPKAVINTEKGISTLESFIAILVALEITEQLQFFIPKQRISPIQLAKLLGKQRQRASNSTSKKIEGDDNLDW